ncbi:hypothetical protein [Mucilaginibacter sp. CSA2-8R]|uniref:hypothetical protein n=1 Tax=Mucilaginibacter sp. CSA2-8R TaxID=3141542 RepID=UPI00315D6630
MKKTLFYLTILSLVFCLLLTGRASAQFLSDNLTGRPITANAYSEISGSPYLNDTWSVGMVKLANGDTYKNNLYLKYNLLDDEVYFKGKNDETLAFVDPVKEFTIGDGSKHYRAGYEGINGFKTKAFFQVIADGAVKLLKKTSVVITEIKQYSAASNKFFERSDLYIIYRNNKGQIVKKDKKSILSVLGDKQNELESYLKSNNINFKSDADLGKLITYYNSL